MINGWITAFFPYLRDHDTGRASVPHWVLFEDDRERIGEHALSG